MHQDTIQNNRLQVYVIIHYFIVLSLNYLVLRF